MRTGIGFDIHRFQEGRRFILGGVEIPFHKGLLGHSDGDALLHSIGDAILGAMAKPDIGYYFPDTDRKLEGLNSAEIIKKVLSVMEAEKYVIENIDAVIICQEPRLLPFFEAIRTKLAGLMGIDPGKIGLKAKTFELMGDIGRGDACACLVSVLLAGKS
ncbi:MAG TPA: 2-C-methyl-D-erythritol 2,4-cyclodiphosphate synthase [bacterium]|jgi:2-C-methyl-D-erythritol 2,4-cyclodiphosphate synthase|nr:2-C-methyl-D-erythritol 2,4-cyclodiphosphate synthase [bacterium]